MRMRVWNPGGNKMAETNGAKIEIKAHQQTYDGFLVLMKYGTIISAIAAAFVVYLIAN